MRKRISYIFILVIMCVILASGCSAQPKTAASITPSPVLEPTPRPESFIKFSANSYVILAYDCWMICGEITNTGTQAYSGQIAMTLYDADELIGTARGVIENLNGGETRMYAAETKDYPRGLKRVEASMEITETMDNAPDVISFGEHSLAGSFNVNVMVTNNDSVTHSFAVITTGYDDAGDIVGFARGDVNDLSPGETRKVQVFCCGEMENATSFRSNLNGVLRGH